MIFALYCKWCLWLQDHDHFLGMQVNIFRWVKASLKGLFGAAYTPTLKRAACFFFAQGGIGNLSLGNFVKLGFFRTSKQLTRPPKTNRAPPRGSRDHQFFRGELLVEGRGYITPQAGRNFDILHHNLC